MTSPDGLSGRQDREPNKRFALRRHKVLPRRTPGQWPEQSYLYSPSTSSLELEKTSSSETLSISSTPVQKPKSVPDLPPTPPSNRTSGSALTAIPIDGYGQLSQAEVQSGVSTPLINRSPPTPDITPPERNTTNARLQPPSLLKHAISATDSFRTALESQSQSDRGSPVYPSIRLLNEQNYPSSTLSRSGRTHDVGLGLGLETQSRGEVISDVTTPKTSHALNTTTQDLAPTGTIDFDGNWGQNIDVEGDDDDDDDDAFERAAELVFVQNAIAPSSRAKRQINGHQFFEQSIYSPQKEIFQQYDQSRPKRRKRLPFHDETKSPNFMPDQPSFDRHIGATESVNGLVNMQEEDVRTETYSRRISSISTNSTIIREAVVLDYSPKRMPTLRRVGKASSLRKLEDQSDLPRTRAIDSTRGTRKLGRPSAKDFHKSMPKKVKLFGADPTSENVIPRRDVSLHREDPVFADQRSRSQSTIVAANDRIVVSEKPLGSYFDLPKRRRTYSDGNPKHKEYRFGHGQGFPPSIPKRSSSLSAPTSRNGSRAASLTSNSIRSQYEQIETDHGEREVVTDKLFPKEFKITQDLLFGQARPSQITPFSQPSSSPEAMEVSQARTVNFYPHSNHSVNLVIQSNSRRTTSDTSRQILFSKKEKSPPRPLQRRTSLPAITYSPPQTPVHYLQALDKVDSPLRNPRAPPSPPKFMVIPPTPSNAGVESPSKALSNSEATDVTASFSQIRNSVRRVRRAISQRRQSDTFLSPSLHTESKSSPKSSPSLGIAIVRRLSRRNNVGSVEAKPRALHPFWRPRDFWTNFENEAEGEYVMNEDFLDRGWTPWLDNHQGEDAHRFSYEIESEDEMPREVTGGRRNIKRFRTALLFGRKSASSEDDDGQSPKRWTSLSSRLRQARTRRREQVAEVKRKELLGSISTPKPVNMENADSGF